ncbi:MAG: Trp biosynthesis-associated membrane protein [Terrimesophilobacter sp.]
MSGRRLRSVSILVGLLLAGLSLVSWSQSWYIVTLVGQSAGHPALEVGGDVSAPAIAALALAAAASFAAMAISGPFFRIVLAVLDVALGACIVLSAVLAISSPETAVGPAVTQATSVAGTGPIADLVGSNTSTIWPYVALAAGALLSVLGVGILLTARAWPSSARRYEPVRFVPVEKAEPGEEVRETVLGATGDTAVSEWDELSGGTDPTSR